MNQIKTRTQKEYIARINRVIDYINNNLFDKLTLGELANVAAFSPFHFHRIFKAMVGEGVNEFINRLRLERAANRLKNNPDSSITEISLECGFSSSSHFARAFKKNFGYSATQFREMINNGMEMMISGVSNENSNIDQMISKDSKANSKHVKDIPPLVGYNYDGRNTNQNQGRNDEMKVEIKNLPGYHVAYVRVMNPFANKAITPAFDKVITWATARDLTGEETLYIGVSLDNPEITPAEKCRYDACVTVPSNIKGEGEIGIYDIPAGKYAVYSVAGEYTKISQQIGRVWDDFMGEWFPNSGYLPDDRPCFEIYRETEEDRLAGKFLVDLCEPVKPL